MFDYLEGLQPFELYKFICRSDSFVGAAFVGGFIITKLYSSRKNDVALLDRLPSIALFQVYIQLYTPFSTQNLYQRKGIYCRDCLGWG